MITFYAIKHKPTGFLMPSGRGRGFTHDEPEDPNVIPPRLFRRKQDAQSALNHWLAGRLRVSHTRTGDWFGSDDRETWEYEADPCRRAEDMEVVEMFLT